MADLDCTCLVLQKPCLPFVWTGCVSRSICLMFQMPALDFTWQVQGFIALAWHELVSSGWMNACCAGPPGAWQCGTTRPMINDCLHCCKLSSAFLRGKNSFLPATAWMAKLQKLTPTSVSWLLCGACSRSVPLHSVHSRHVISVICRMFTGVTSNVRVSDAAFVYSQLWRSQEPGT